MRLLRPMFLLTAGFVLAGSASADVFDLSTTNVGGLCAGSCGTVTVTFAAGTIHFSINVAPNTIFGQGGGAFGFNVVGSNAVTISNIVSSPTFGFSGDSGNMDGMGSYEFKIDGPNAPGQATLSFDVTRPGNPFTGVSDVYQASSGGNSPAGGGFFAAHIASAGNIVTGFAQTGTTPRPPQETVPEPSTVVLLGTVAGGLCYRLRRRRLA